MDPIAQIFAQSAGGSANGQGFGQFFAEGVRMGQNQQQLNLSKRRLQFEEDQARARQPIMELERERMLQQMAVMSLDMQKTQSDNSYAISLRDAELQVSRFMSELAQNGSWGSPESWQKWQSITNSVPLAAVSKSGQLFLQQQRLAMANQQLARQFGGPMKVTVPTPEGGDATFGDAAARGYAPSDIQKNLQALSEAEAAGNADAVAALRKHLKLDGMDRTAEIMFRSELRSLDSNMFLSEAEKENRRESILQKYQTQPAAPKPEAPSAPDEKVMVVDPQGKKFWLPRRQLEDALKRGFKEFEG